MPPFLFYDLCFVGNEILCGDVGVMVSGAVFGKTQSVGDEVVQLFVGLGGFEEDGLLGAVDHAGIAAQATMVPLGLFVGHGDIFTGADLLAQAAAHTAARSIEALVILMLDIEKRHHHLIVAATGNGGHSGVFVGLTGGDLLADAPGAGIGIRHHQLGCRERLIGHALAGHAAQGLAVVQISTLFPEDGVHRLKASAVDAHIGSHHKSIGLGVDGEILYKRLHGFGDIPLIHRAEKTHHIGVHGKVAFRSLLHGDNGGTAHFLSDDSCGIQTVAGAAETIDYFFHNYLIF